MRIKHETVWGTEQISQNALLHSTNKSRGWAVSHEWLEYGGGLLVAPYLCYLNVQLWPPWACPLALPCGRNEEPGASWVLRKYVLFWEYLMLFLGKVANGILDRLVLFHGLLFLAPPTTC